jgi:hypothetical protein
MQLYGGRPLIATEVGPADGVKITAEAVRKAYDWFAMNGIPMMGWVLNAAGGPWGNAEWISNGVIL